ncbi:MAG TPA: hypothetical protein VNA30_08435 [Mycobacteriales bacterium]|nr:hypothetical protein [Mycobacteriales bacterium]
MIVISGVLVLVAIVLIVIGVASPDLGFVYASIGVSLLASVFLAIGTLQRRRETLPATSAPAKAPERTTADLEGVTAVVPTARREAPTEEPVATTETQLTGSVLVVPGRPRYHVAGCRFLTGRSPDSVTVTAARQDGFSACAVCKPDAALQADAGGAPSTRAAGTRTAGTRTAGSGTRTSRAPAKATTRGKAAPAAPKSVAKSAAPKAAAKSASAKRGVIVIPDRGRFHQSDCRFVRDASDTEEVSRAVATRRGFQACGVCKP